MTARAHQPPHDRWRPTPIGDMPSAAPAKSKGAMRSERALADHHRVRTKKSAARGRRRHPRRTEDRRSEQQKREQAGEQEASEEKKSNRSSSFPAPEARTEEGKEHPPQAAMATPKPDQIRSKWQQPQATPALPN